ncbi:MAG: protein kinase [Anaerolineae bacterium]|nr:protein kinase [Anaerolineae bacterium]
MNENLSGTMIRGYRIKASIGSGGFGSVYRAYQPIIDREVAIKVIHARYANQLEFIRRFEIEARLIARLEHAHIVPLYDYWRDPTGAYLVMRALRGGSLRDRLTEHGALALQTTVQWVTQIAEALAIAHQHNIIHRDLKPENILLDQEGNAYLTDFGIAIDTLNPYNEVMLKNLSFGSPAYMSPEQLHGLNVSPEGDIYSLGVLLFEALTAQIPFSNETLLARKEKQALMPIPSVVSLRPDLPSTLDNVIWRATAQNPRARYPDMRQFIQALHMATQGIVTGIPMLRPMLARSDDANATGIIGMGGVGDTPKPPDSPMTQAIAMDDFTTRMIDPNAPIEEREADLSALQYLILRNPYKGLRAFEEVDSDDFYGRQDAITRLIRRLPTGRFLAVVGPSGSGKSSLARAGLIASLRHGRIEGSDRWLYVTLQPGPRPLEALREALLGVAAWDVPDFSVTPSAMYELLCRLGPTLLLIDQFEEVFTLCEDETIRERFLALLADAVTQAESPLRLVITLRADFYDRPLHYPAFGALVRESTEVVLPLSPHELEEAIVTPATNIGLMLEAPLIRVLIEDLYGQTGALPLLQYALTQLFDQRDELLLTERAYQAIGGASGALAQRAEQVYHALTPSEQAIAHRLFLRLITVSDQTITRKRLLWSELPAEAEKIVQAFGKDRLLTLDRDPITRSPTVEIAHEALITRWQRLADWIAVNRADLQTAARLATITEDWERAERDRSFLAGGSRLAEFEALLDHALVSLSPAQRAFIEAGQRLRQRGQRRTQVVIALLTLLLLIACGFAIVAFDQQGREQIARAEALRERDRANQEAQFSRSRELAALALTQSEHDLALLLSVSAYQTAPTFEARHGLLSALQTHPAIQTYLHGHTSVIRAVGVYGDRIASADAQGMLQIWSRSTHDSIGAPIPAHQGPIYALAIDANGILTAGADAKVSLWDHDGQAIVPPILHDAAVWSVALTAQQIAIGDELGQVVVYDRADQTVIWESTAHQDMVYALAYSPDGMTLASAGGDGRARLFDAIHGTPIGDPFEEHAGFALALAYAPDGTQLASTGADGQVVIYDLTAPRVITAFDTGHRNYPRAIAYNPTGEILATASLDGTIRLWDARSGQALIDPLIGHQAAVWDMAFYGDLQWVSSGAEGQLILWDIQPPSRPAMGAWVSVGPIARIAFSADQMITGHDDGTITLADRVSGEPLGRWTGHRALITGLAVFGDRVISTSADQSAIVWDLATGEMIYHLTGHRSVINDFTIVEDRLYTASDDGTIQHWDLQTGEGLGVLIAIDSPLSLTYSETTGHLIVGTRTGAIYRVDREGQTIGEPWTAHQDAVTTLSTQGPVLISGGRDRQVIIWDLLVDNPTPRLLSGHGDWVQSVTLDLEKGLIVSGGRDQTVRLWDLQTGRALGQPWLGHVDAVTQVAFHDGHVYSVGRDGNVIGWITAVESWQTLACAIANRPFNLIEREWYRLEDTIICE